MADVIANIYFCFTKTGKLYIMFKHSISEFQPINVIQYKSTFLLINGKKN